MNTCEITFEKELAAYEAHREVLKAKSGKFVLVHGSEIVDIWDTYEDALQAGYEKFGLDSPFLVKKIEAIDGIQFFTRDISCQASPPASSQ